MRAAWTLALLPIAAAFAASQGNAQSDPAQSDLADQQRRLLAARAQSAAAAERAAKLDAAAKAEQNEAAKARAEEEAMGARIQQAQADIAAASARVTLVDRLLGDQQARLAAQQGPIARLIAALCSLAQRPDAVSVMQPGSVGDLVHVRAVIGSTLPLVRARTAGLRADLNNTRRLRADAALAAHSLTEGRRRLETNRIALARLEAEHRLKSQDLSRSALAESDRAIGLGERARDLVDNMQETTDGATTARALAALSGPLPRPGEATDPPLSWTGGTAPYRVPVTGKLVTGFGEVSADAGVTSRGLTWAVPGGADIAAPAAGKVLFAGPFRDYGRIVVIDHGGGWSTVLIGLGTLSVTAGQRVGQGALLGAAPQGEDRQVTAELRRKGRPIDPVALTG
ncbi:murein hydrolase activator EnvC family protein [Sphingomonas asaccharolytica]|uniref:murein hydrolase activator EnvC family protein n=1 Tax=Sphingomonas asaccharolytica TaxID=40681 RepID=UPI0008367640|nr:peptidoglycan DD-metalloendopeptidase family protein [Sphingomonas asaccharolytica]